MPSWLELLLGGQAPQFPQGAPQPAPPFDPQRMAVAPVFAQAPQMAQDVAAGIADPLLKAGNYLGGIMQGSQQFSWPETIQHGAALAMAMAPGPKGERIAGGIERGLAGAAESAAPAGIRAYHGSPYDFPAFDISKIGTGEGAQAYGHGLYMAENEATAKAYRQAGQTRPSGIQYEGNNPVNIPRDQFGQLPKLTQETLAFVRDEANIGQAVQNATARNRADIADEIMRLHNSGQLTQGFPPKGHMYEVNIKAQPEQFLDWDKPLSEQSPQVREAMRQYKSNLVGEENPAALTTQPRAGESAYQTLARELGSEQAAVSALREAGIPGIKYLDQGSRAARAPYRGDTAYLTAANSFKGSGASPDQTLAGLAKAYTNADPATLKAAVHEAYDIQPQQTHNYVVFNDKLIDILRKYGLAGMLGGSAAAPIFASQGQQQQ